MKSIVCLVLILVHYTCFAANVMWRCADNSQQAVASTGVINGTKQALYLSFLLNDNQATTARPILSNATVVVPADMESQSYITLGGKGNWLMNCVGVMSKGNIVFDVNNNAFDCPLIPKSCASDKNNLLQEP